MIDKIKLLVTETWRLLKFLVEHFFEDSCQTTAAALTYQTLFAVVPALTMMYWGISGLDAFGGMGRTVEDFIFGNIVPENVAAVQEFFHMVRPLGGTGRYRQTDHGLRWSNVPTSHRLRQGRRR